MTYYFPSLLPWIVSYFPHDQIFTRYEDGEEFNTCRTSFGAAGNENTACCSRNIKKWYDVSPNSHVGDIVLISDKSCPRNQCRPLARVTEVYPSKDGLVRKVLLLVSQSGKKKLLERPIHKLILIFRPNEDESDA